jgi:hypothetical protein
MEMDFTELHFAAISVMKKVHSHGVQEKAMSKRAHKRARTVEVQIMFEPSRLAQECLHKAYRCLVPVAKRRLLTHMTGTPEPSPAQIPARERTLP